jgi:AraC-like DNA-binding protein
MLDIFRSTTEFRHDAIASYLKLFLIECNGHCSLHPEGNPQSEEVGRTLVKRFKELVEKHYPEWHQVKEYALHLHVTPGYLNEVIKTAIGQSAKDYIQNRIVLEARRLTLFTSKSSKEIGFELGFEDPAHFSKFVKSFTGESLAQFKNRE